jgi:hypothetical protein
MANFERDDEAFSGPFLYERFENLGHLIHLDMQTSFPGLYLVLRLCAFFQLTRAPILN